ncbi:hypothetical protein HL273_20540 [Yersinia enterocolitica]|uniref:hypothetical protein n=1 Tax=Yersinia enterocolitica TaxID=630 RepID=UPI00155B2D6B|nr:hypothetical protein [Yersinia enterocolitica]MBX9485257.1 hypothetical protein [Yersinia enterocolitica]NQS96476.1 hypothetical protein [Yersinia enterocolitica]NQT45655.1 hypothetical protein [Yersinia enterocolitica]NQU02320.1 hypothetical protein [Yersinia enterocolitica]HDM8448849.1 hypothetical protein [Yersinia enterocolitica]
MAGEIKAGCPAFPFVPGEGSALYESEGMTLRDYFAVRAMQSIPLALNKDEQSVVAQASYEMADAMIKARG